MGDEIRLPSAGAPEQRPVPSGLYAHYCEREGCKEWGGWGYSRNKRETRWFCFAHRDDGEAILAR